MSGMFDDINTNDFEEDEDRVGGFTPLPSDIYDAKVKVVYLGKSSGGSDFATVILDVNGREVKETLYYRSKEGKTFYEKDGKKHPIPGMRTLMDLCELAANKTIQEVGKNVSNKIIKVYDPDQKKEINKPTPVFDDLTGCEIKVAISNTEEPSYRDATKIVKSNKFSKFLDSRTSQTLSERTKNIDSQFAAEWLEKWKGTVRKTGTVDSDVKSGSPASKRNGTKAAPATELFPEDE